MKNTSLITFTLNACLFILSACQQDSTTPDINTESSASLESLGEILYFDDNLSNPPGQSCASCHLPSAGFADPDNHFPTSEGIIPGRFGNRNSPTSRYAATIPEFHFDADRNQFVGGQFLDGRAATLEDQAQGPFINPLEMNNANKAQVIEKIRSSAYASDFEAVFGTGALDDTDQAYVQVSQAIAAFERTGTFSPFNSRFDQVENGTAVFTLAEQRGRALFNGKAQCVRCHSTPVGAQVFSDFSFKNIGTPANPDNPFLALDASLNPDGPGFVDTGLGGVLDDPLQDGKFRVPTLRNVNETAPYMHNGVFDTLEEVIEFYNRRDIDGIEAEIPRNVNNAGNIGELGLTDDEIQDLIAFLMTLSDR